MLMTQVQIVTELLLSHDRPSTKTSTVAKGQPGGKIRSSKDDSGVEERGAQKGGRTARRKREATV